ncbi:MAG TPA: L,D-transpeptidase/peptidoglycan binding protein, partial [Clostridium sp.]
IIISFCSVLVIYLGISIYFTNHFYFSTKINNIDASGKTVEEVGEQIKAYTLKLEERDGVNEEIKAEDIGLKYASEDKIQALKDSQNPFGWVASIFNKDENNVSDMVTYDKELLKKYVDKLSCFDSSKIIEPQNPKLEYTDKGYEIIDEVYGNKINKDTLDDNVVNAILTGKTTINLESINCYETTKYTASSQEVMDAKNNLDKYTSSKITYTFGEKTEDLDGSTIHSWLSVDENMGVIFDEKKIENYVDTLGSKYNTVGNTRDFKTSSGTTVKVSGGTYGWLINSEEEVQALITSIKEGQTITKEPIYSQKGITRNANEIGSTYVEINMSNQHLSFYKNGSLIVEGSVVTGNVSNGTSTPTGTYYIEYVEKNATLKGEGYSVPVSYWMPFNNGIGIHDATWRSSFGGSIYKSSGSHGCVNAPYSLANTIFNNIDAGTPVVCFY